MKLESNQQVFDIVVTHLAKQGTKSIGELKSYPKERCKYRHETGNKKKVLKCAVGCLIPKKLYKKEIDESQSVVNVYKLIQFKEYSYLEPYAMLLQSLQTAHDNSYNKERLVLELTYIARFYNLKPDKISLITEWNC